MKKLILSLVTLLFLSSPAMAWNDKGHMVVAKLAWDRLTPAERTAAIGILTAHPHYKEFLAVGRHDNIPDDQWVFMRAATWPIGSSIAAVLRVLATRRGITSICLMSPPDRI